MRNKEVDIHCYRSYGIYLLIQIHKQISHFIGKMLTILNKYNKLGHK